MAGNTKLDDHLCVMERGGIQGCVRLMAIGGMKNGIMIQKSK